MPQVVAASESHKTKEVLIVIGYSDDLHIKNFSEIFYPRYSLSINRLIQQSIDDKLFETNFVNDKTNENVYENIEKNTRVTLLNSNYQCPGEVTDIEEFQRKVCKEQLKLSKKIKEFLGSNLNKFNEFIYIGHSRLGRGLGIGPFTEEYTFDLEFFSNLEAGNLKKR